jgi:hypothetical protein
VHQRRPDAAELVRGDRHADAGAVHQDADVRLARLDRAGDGAGVIRVVDGAGAVAAEVLDLVPELLQERHEAALGLVTAVIVGDGDFHSM